MDVQRAAVLILVPPPDARDRADGRRALEVALEEGVPSAIVLPCGGGRGGTRGLGLMGRGLLGFEVGACLWLVLVLCCLCVACLSGVAWL